MDSTGITPVMNVGSGYADGFGGFGGGMWIFGLLILLGLMNGGFGGGTNSNAIQADVNRGFDNQNLQAQTRDILGAVTSGTAQTIAASTANATNAINAIKDGNASLIREFGNVETALTALGGNLQNCCCSIQRNIDQTNYNLSNGVASINATTVAQTQKILDAMAANEIQALRDKVSSLELQSSLTGVVKYPQSMTFAYANNPFCGCNGLGNI
jgi:hypothetical protein